MRTRSLDLDEAARLIDRVCGPEAQTRALAVQRVRERGLRSVSLAEVYRACAASGASC